MYTQQDIERNLKKLGISTGDMLFVRISYKAIGKVEGGPKAVIDAILNVIGDEGTLLATAFPKRIPSYKRWFHRNYIYKKGMKPSTGAIPSVMCTYSNAFFSSNPISPYVAIGKNAEKITSIHRPDTESYAIVKYIITNYNPKCLRIGGNELDGTTHLALSEVLSDREEYQVRLPSGIYFIENGVKKWKERTVSKFCYNGYKQFYIQYIQEDPSAVLKSGKVGEGDAVVTSMTRTYMIEKRYISEDPRVLFCKSDSCMTCRVSFSYSDYSKFSYIKRNFRRLFTTEWKEYIREVRVLLRMALFGKHCI